MGVYTRNQVDSAQDRDYQRAIVNAVLNLQIPHVMELVIIIQLYVNVCCTIMDIEELEFIEWRGHGGANLFNIRETSHGWSEFK